MTVQLSRDQGICPESETIDLPGTCNNGIITMNTDTANLEGSISDDNQSALLNGYVNFTIGGLPLRADVNNMQLHKQS